MVALATWIESEQSAPAAKNRVGDFFAPSPGRVGKVAPQVVDRAGETSFRAYDLRRGYVLDPKKKEETKEEKCGRLERAINGFKNWYSNAFGNKAPLNDINDFFEDNPNNFYASKPDFGAPAFRDPNAGSPWSSINFKEPFSTTVFNGLQYSVLRGTASSGGRDVPDSLNGQYAASPNPPAYIGRTGAAIDAASGLLAGQMDSQMMLSKFSFVHSNFNGGWFINDVSINSNPVYLPEGQGRMILEGVFDSYDKALSEYYKSGCDE